MLAELRYAAEHRLDYHYLGYWIAQCPSMAYKSSYGPHQLLQRYVADDEEPQWESPTDLAADARSTFDESLDRAKSPH